MKKTIKIKFVGFWPDFEPNKSILIECLKKRYNVQIIDEEPEYIICSVFGRDPYEYCKYPQPRIMYSGENYIPDFNLIDYSICSYPIVYLDRNFRLPYCFAIDQTLIQELANKNREYDYSILKEKEYFANFIASHESEGNIRGDFFKKLSEYKRVEACGSYLNNMPNGERVNRNNKVDFQRKTKFTLCFESTKHEGFITEKISDAFYADTIPVYYGSSDVKTIFNEKAFINCADYETFDEAIEKIIEIDNDDKKYMKMLRQPIFAEEFDPDAMMKSFEQFLYNIFDQPIESVYRRSRVYSAKYYNDYLAEVIRRKDIVNVIPIGELIKILIRKVVRKYLIGIKFITGTNL